ncbi:MAG: hypothetical protein K2Y42_00060 [Hyphomicrobium sp.]|uniref:hypothetical protein n=1 Tax=Hyphomicrobium sp. TaxID=82 RepID=UPI0025C2C81B|nr:hypothetical protein [Hyphomicrobium sp.]MBX9861116.1 hypothetical protein [Hyphomicrobium sp.]
MFFLIRCAFWLTIVFSSLPWNEHAVRSDLAKGADLARESATDKLHSLCLTDPAACARHAAMVGKALGVSASSNSLLPSDLTPAWKGRPQPTAMHRAQN